MKSGEYNKLSHYWQITRAVFTDGTLKSSEVERKLTGLYHTLFEAFSTAVGVTERCYIPRKERNQNLVIVFSPQVLGLGHAPTKTLLDRSYVLKTFLHKEVMIVNTAMYMTKKRTRTILSYAGGRIRSGIVRAFVTGI